MDLYLFSRSSSRMLRETSERRGTPTPLSARGMFNSPQNVNNLRFRFSVLDMVTFRAFELVTPGRWDWSDITKSWSFGREIISSTHERFYIGMSLSTSNLEQEKHQLTNFLRYFVRELATHRRSRSGELENMRWKTFALTFALIKSRSLSEFMGCFPKQVLPW